LARPRFDKLDPSKQAAILDAAMKEFAANGYEQASYNRIIEKAGVSKGAMYYYFDDKADLYATVYKHVQTRLVAILSSTDPVEDTAAFWQRVQQVTERLIAFTLDNPTTIALMRSAWRLQFHGDHPVLKELFEFAHQWTAQLLQQGQAVGAVRSDFPFDLMVEIVTAVDHIGDCWFMEHSELDQQTLKQWGMQYVNLLWRMLHPGLSGPASDP